MLEELAGLGAQRQALLAEVEQATDRLRVAAVAAVKAGHSKFYVARDAGVTRRTLDKWIAEEGFGAVDDGLADDTYGKGEK